MSRMTNDGDTRMIPKDQIDSPSLDDISCGGTLLGGGVLKKGPWTSNEDAILVDYVKKHGEGNWNAVQKQSGLSRCGKSCRLRWANHLRPNLKKGAFSAEEEQLIVELHAKMGNKWARMAAHLPGRTDNEIKNYWNTRIKRHQRANLPLYPPNVCFQHSNENQRSQSPSEYRACDGRHNEQLQPDGDDIPDVSFNDPKAIQGALPYPVLFPGIPMSSMLGQVLGSQNYGLRVPINHVTYRLPAIEQFQSDTSDKIHRPFGYGLPYDPDPGSKNLAPFSGAISGSHALLNGNLSTSQPHSGTGKLELPSLQCSKTDLSGWSLPSPLEAVDACVESPPATVSMPCNFDSPQNSGLLYAVVQQSETKNQSSEKNQSFEGSMLNHYNTEWKDFSDPSSPLGISTASILSESTPPTSTISLDESATGKELSYSKVKSGPAEHVSTTNVEDTGISPRPDLKSRPDALLGSDWCYYSARDQSVLSESISALLGEDFYGDCNIMPAGTSSSLNQELGFGSYLWDNLPSVCQMSEIP